jgi:hypothetical protein
MTEHVRDAARTLNNAMDSVNLINQINEGDFSYFLPGYTQEVVNRRVQENVQHLEIILAYEEVVEDETDKTPYTTAIATGKAYIQENS